MAMSGFICHDDYYDRLKRLSNEEVGNLFRQLMLYHAGRYEEMSDFIDSEGIAFDFIANDIERMEEKHNATSETNRINGSKGGRPKKQKEPEETGENPTKPTKTESNPIKGYKDKDKDKDKELLYNNDNAHTHEDELMEIQTEQNRVLDAAEDAGFLRSNTVRAKLIELYAVHGLDKMLSAIDSCVHHGVINLAYLEACLKGEPKKAKKTNAQDYEQRDYSGEQDAAMERLMNWVKEA